MSTDIALLSVLLVLVCIIGCGTPLHSEEPDRTGITVSKLPYSEIEKTRGYNSSTVVLGKRAGKYFVFHAGKEYGPFREAKIPGPVPVFKGEPLYWAVPDGAPEGGGAIYLGDALKIHVDVLDESYYHDNHLYFVTQETVSDILRCCLYKDFERIGGTYIRYINPQVIDNEICFAFDTGSDVVTISSSGDEMEPFYPRTMAGRIVDCPVIGTRLGLIIDGKQVAVADWISVGVVGDKIYWWTIDGDYYTGLYVDFKKVGEWKCNAAKGPYIVGDRLLYMISYYDYDNSGISRDIIHYGDETYTFDDCQVQVFPRADAPVFEIFNYTDKETTIYYDGVLKRTYDGKAISIAYIDNGPIRIATMSADRKLAIFKGGEVEYSATCMQSRPRVFLRNGKWYIRDIGDEYTSVYIGGKEVLRLSEFYQDYEDEGCDSWFLYGKKDGSVVEVVIEFD